MNGHVSVRIPDSDNILINSHSACRSTLTSEDIIEVDLEGRSVLPEYHPPGEVPIHTEIYKKRKDVQAVIHNHPHYATVLTIANQPVLPVFGLGAFLSNVPLFDDPDLINTEEKATKMVDALGSSRIVMLQSHGAVTTGASLQEAFAAAVFLEENAKKQVEALRITNHIKVFNEEEQARIGSSNWKPKIVNKIWIYYESLARMEGKLQDIESGSDFIQA